ncbi:MAG TPA: cupin domain-containing protein [Gammaproteobacteria bacterium]|nr:cupin domain-containing protein [Gammaproteobacteria bacterium]
MSSGSDKQACREADRLEEYALGALSSREMREMAEHVSGCAECRRELESLGSVVDELAYWPRNLVRPSPSLWGRLAERVAAETGEAPLPAPERRYREPEWKQVAPGIECKLLARDAENGRISMLVRLAPGGAYPPHRHAGVEELHLLDGELWIEDRLLYPGDYNIAYRGTGDTRVYSETGCTCVLITSTKDVIA